jgi:hypothetical protein
MSFITWLVLPLAITLVASLIMLLMSHRPRTDTHQDIENFARFRGALAPQATLPPDSSPTPSASAAEERQSPAGSGIATSPDR